jgi:hypothetical protein
MEAMLVSMYISDIWFKLLSESIRDYDNDICQ